MPSYPTYAPRIPLAKKGLSSGAIIAIVVAVILVAVVVGALLAGAFFFAATQHASNLTKGITYTHGTVSSSQRLRAIAFQDPNNASNTVASSVSSAGAYAVYLRDGIIYRVYATTNYSNTLGCIPGSFAPSGADDSQNFNCS